MNPQNKTSLQSILITVCGVLTSATFTHAATIGGPFVSPVNGHNYYVLDAKSWAENQSEALSLGGQLATIRNFAKDDWIATQIVSSFPNLTIGLNDRQNESQFVWASGEVSLYTNWGLGALGEPEPNNFRPDDEDAVFIDAAGKWHDFDNDPPYVSGSAASALVEVVPEPSTALFSAIGILGLALGRIRNQRSA